MLNSPRYPVVLSALLVTAILAWAAVPVAASPGDGRAGDAPRRAPGNADAHRGAQQLKFQLKKAIRAGEVWTSFWWAPATCDFGFAATYSPGLVIKVSNYAPGATEPASVVLFQYDRLGNPLLQEIRYQMDGAVQWDRTECAYAGAGDLHKAKLVYKLITSSEFPPSPVYRVTWNSRDQRELETEEFDFDQDGTLDFLRYTRYAYNGDGLLIEQVFEHDNDANGTVDFRYAARATYDARHRIRSIVKGFYDFPGGPFVPYKTFVVTIDEAHGSAIATDETDYDGDGVSDDTSRWTTFTDAAGRYVRGVYESDYYGRPDGGADGVIDYVMRERNEYDDSGNLVHAAFDVSGDSTLSFTEDFRHTYDGHGRRIQTFYSTDTYFDDLVVSETETTTYTRDQRGNVVEERAVRLTSWFSQTRRVENRYDGIGNLIETTDSFWWNDDAPEPGYRSTYEYGAGRSGQVGSRKD